MERELSRVLSIAIAWLVFSAATASAIVTQDQLKQLFTSIIFAEFLILFIAAAVLLAGCFGLFMMIRRWRRSAMALRQFNEKLKIDNIKLQNDKDELTIKIAQHETVQEALRNRLDEQSQAMQLLQDKNRELTQTNSRLEAAFDNLEIDRRLHDVLKSKLEEHIRARGELEAGINELRAAKAGLEERAGRLGESEYRLREEVAERMRTEEKLREDNDRLRLDNERLYNEIERLRIEIQELHRERARLQI